MSSYASLYVQSVVPWVILPAHAQPLCADCVASMATCLVAVKQRAASAVSSKHLAKARSAAQQHVLTAGCMAMMHPDARELSASNVATSGT